MGKENFNSKSAKSVYKLLQTSKNIQSKKSKNAVKAKFKKVKEISSVSKRKMKNCDTKVHASGKKKHLSNDYKLQENNVVKSNHIKAVNGKKTESQVISFPYKKICLYMEKLLYNDKISCTEDLGKITFQWLLGNISVERFFSKYWQKNFLLIRANPSKYCGLFSSKSFDNILRKNALLFGKNIDATTYIDGKRETHNPEGRALAPVVWDYYNTGCSIRFLNPQTYSTPVWKLLERLQEYFHSFCGANVYLTPPGTQGFAPHWDDIEAFILQLEGKKRWRVYKPRSLSETLPRESSRNFGLIDDLGNPILDTVLEPGDLLYFPRGFIHQGEALNLNHSLHITISTFQKNSWVDLLEKFLPATLSAAAAENVEFRKGIPRDCLKNAGLAYSMNLCQESRTKLVQKLQTLVDMMMKTPAIDTAVDQLAKEFIHDALPPVMTDDEKCRSIYEGAEQWSSEVHAVVGRAELEPETCVRFIRKGFVRLLREESTIKLYHTAENSREYHAEEPKYIEIESNLLSGVQTLIEKYPNYMKIEELPLETLEQKMALACGLYEKGLLCTSDILDSMDD